MPDFLKVLLRSRKFWLAVFGCVQAVVLHYANVPDEIWQSIVVLVGVLIASIAVEDAAEKHAPTTVINEIAPEEIDLNQRVG